MSTIMEQTWRWAAMYGLSVLGAAVVLLVGLLVTRLLSRVASRLMNRAKMESTLVGFLSNILRAFLIILVVVATLSKLGVQTASLVAMLGAAGLAVGLALRTHLGNLAAGILLLIFRPFKVGQVVEAAGTLGTVEELSIMSTKLKQVDGVAAVLPNSKVIGEKIINYHEKPVRRVDLVIGVGYGDDLKKAKEVIGRVLSEDPRVLADPAPRVDVLELAESSVNLAVRPWVKREDYWDARCELMEAIKLSLEAGGVTIPFPQRDVHLFSQPQTAAA